MTPEPWRAQPLPDDEQADPFTLADEERAAIMRLWVGIRARIVGTDELLAHVTGLASAYRSQGYVMGDLAHDETLRAQAEAEADGVVPLQKCLRCLELCEPGFACVDGENPSCPRPCRPVAEGGRIR